MPKPSSATINVPLPATNALKHAERPNVIVPAKIEWQTDDAGNKVPVSGEFGDVYFSHADGLAESRHVFLAHNQLPERLANLVPQQCFTIAELGFGTGLNFLATWQLWRQLRLTHSHLDSAHLHFITTEKYPIPLTDLKQILALWAQRAPELAELIEQLLASYPPLIAGCHRLNFFADNITLDIWLGDAGDSLASLGFETAIQRPYIDAWFLDGFAPSCNEILWAASIFMQIQRLSRADTTAATYSCAGIVKRGLQAHGFAIKKVKGFGRKREMLTAVMTEPLPLDDHPTLYTHPNHTVVIGAGVAGLLTAWTLANRGINVTILDKSAPLSGASGNPRALLAPNMTPIHHVYEHLHSIGYLYSGRLYRDFNKQAAIQRTPLILEQTGTLDLLVKTNIGTEQIADYPNAMAATITTEEARRLSGLKAKDLADNLYLPQSGLVNPQALKTVTLAHSNINYQQFSVTDIKETEDKVTVSGNNSQSPITIIADNVVICAAYESHQLDKRIVACRTIRGQLSWFTPTAEQITKLPKLPLKYSGYCAPFIGQSGDAELNNIIENQSQFLLGASFVDGDANIDIRLEENQQNYDKLIEDMPELADVLITDPSLWQARAGIRTQTLDYHPLVGLLAQSKRLWTLSAMGAKGYALAPICAEALADMMLGCFTPLSSVMLTRLSPNRARLHKARNNVSKLSS
ncbi:tRNA (5-methylaminomethyl-2-thiouridine)(34)-methyltransferase MnmD [Psychrobacter sp. DAB_AL43B]|uniref:tRNA (5-methylaminomethyl-2-thiouridine)(34)-methyltransferase MnmD n=1 Tax=Psychrobacter sp. DAB_AL43B TaxID=1028416 RepID=UPI0009A5FCAA|nr:tRNA (5-methylaminomethyl-2-thiouridine)(34)-methyltransferase MnmD [Psychrobacter sp. DAB_AL43B]SLJ85456.1 bifunctional tRNA (mnm(5)s(2)U34)-methyltransferase/FAD-dependent cmnm(5)s(2)U34 oxidoreductase [Psychrobacter sp. DAB_AL43B]